MEPRPCAGRGGAKGNLGNVAGISLSSENRGATWRGGLSTGIGAAAGGGWGVGAGGGWGAGTGGGA